MDRQSGAARGSQSHSGDARAQTRTVADNAERGVVVAAARSALALCRPWTECKPSFVSSSLHSSPLK